MGFWTYISPFFLGLLLPFGLHEMVLDSAEMAAWPAWKQWSYLGLVGLVLGICFQAIMFGAQGAFAQVLPVPVGKSVRGRSAVVAGSFLIFTVILFMIAMFLRSQDAATGALVCGVAAGVAAIVSLLAYIWSWPMAVKDFAAR